MFRRLENALFCLALAGAALTSCASVQAEHVDAPRPPTLGATEGMWLFNQPPVAQLQKLGFTASPAWMEHVQKSCVRFPGGSGSFVSKDGLVMTNHHVGRDAIDKLSTAEHNYMEHGFYAATREQELKCQDLELMTLWEIQDVTARVQAAGADKDAAAAEAARKKEISAIEKAAQDAKGDAKRWKCEMVTLYQGGRYHLYTYKRFTDLRLVFAPEEGIAFFGGDPDNFEFPRFNLDCSFFRVYENDQPYHPEHYFKWSANGSKEGELVFVAGHPGRTERGYTVAHMESLRDLRYPMTLRILQRREVQLKTFSDRNEENERIARDDLFGVQNSRKVYTGLLSGLLDPALLAAKSAEERALRAWVDADPERRAKWGDGWSLVEGSLAKYRELYARSAAMGTGNLGWGSKLWGHALTLVRLADEKAKPTSERLPEYGDAALPALERRLLSTAPIYPELEINVMDSRLQLMAELLGADDAFVKTCYGGKGPRARAEELVRGSKLLDVAERKRLYEGGKAAIEASKDPMIRLVRALDAEARALRKLSEDSVEGPQRAGYAKIAEARFAAFGDKLYPDATFTLRLAFGLVKGYEENGHVAPFTTYAGLYERHAQRKGVAPFDLPQRWLERKTRLDPAVPFNFVHTADIIGGNSGSPTFNAKGEIVGLIFDGNIQSLIGDLVYTDEQARALSVDSRAMTEAMRKVYDAVPLADELSGDH